MLIEYTLQGPFHSGAKPANHCVLMHATAQLIECHFKSHSLLSAYEKTPITKRECRTTCHCTVESRTSLILILELKLIQRERLCISDDDLLTFFLYFLVLRNKSCFMSNNQFF